LLVLLSSSNLLGDAEARRVLGGRSDGAGSLAGLSGWAAGERSAGAHSGEAVPILGRSFRRVVVAWSGLRGLAGCEMAAWGSYADGWMGGRATLRLGAARVGAGSMG